MNFDEVVSRRQSSSLKWNYYAEDVLPLWVADMDFQSPQCVQEALQKVLEHDIYGYTLPPKNLIRTVIERLDHLYNWQVKASSIVWLPGMVCALNIACRAFTVNSKKVLTSTPIYPPFLEAPIYSEKSLLTTKLIHNNDRFEMDFKAISEKASKSDLYLLCNPHNPVGRVYDENELRKLGEIALKKKMIICSDEIHCDLVLDDTKKHLPIATLSEEFEQNSVTLMAPSKTFNIPGLGFSFAVIPNYKLRKKFLRVMKGILPYPNMMGVAAGLAAYQKGEDWRIKLIEYLKGNRDYLENFIRRYLPQIKYIPGEATYLAWLDFSESGLDNPHKTLVEAGVGLSNGKEFGNDKYLRLNFGCPRSILEEALEKIRKAI